MAKLTAAEQKIIAHLAVAESLRFFNEDGKACYFTLGRGKPNDLKVLQSLAAKFAIIGLAWEADKPAEDRRWEILSEQDENGFRFSEYSCVHHRKVIDRAAYEAWNALPDDDRKMNAGQNGSDTACELGYRDHAHYEAICLAYSLSTYELF